MKRFVLFLIAATAAAASEPHIHAALAACQNAASAAAHNRHQEAAALFAQAIEIEPTYLKPYDGLVQQDLALNLPLPAAAILTKALEIAPEALPRRLLLAHLLLQQKQTQKALAQFSLALDTDPSSADALAGFAAAAHDSGMLDRASQAIAKGHRLYPEDKRFQHSTNSIPQE